MTASDKAQVAEMLHAIGEYEEVYQPEMSAMVGTPGWEEEEEGAEIETEGERSLSDMVQALGEGEHLPSFVPKKEEISRPWIQGVSERRQKKLQRYARQGREGELQEAIERYGLKDKPLEGPGADLEQALKVQEGIGAPPRSRGEGILGEGLINPSVAMGFTGRDVVNPVTQAFLYDLHRRGSAVPTSVANMLGIDRDQMFKPGSVKRSAEYKSKLTQALQRFEANDYAALERVTLERLKSARLVDKDGNPALTEDELIALSKDMSHLSESERQKAIEDLRYDMEYDKTYALQKLKQTSYSHRSGGGRDRALELYKNLGVDLRSQRGHLNSLNKELKKARSGSFPSDEEQATAIGEVEANIERQETLIGNTNKLRDRYWAKMHGLKRDDPLAKAPPVTDDDASLGTAGADWGRDAAAQYKGAGYDRARVIKELARFKEGGVVFDEGVEDAILAEFPEVASEPLKEARAELEELEKKPVSVSQAPRAKRERKERERRRRSLESRIGESERHGKELRRFTSAVDRAEEVLANLGEGRPVSKDEIKSAQQEALGAMRAMKVEYQLEPGAGAAYDRATGRRVGDDIEELESLADLLGEALR